MTSEGEVRQNAGAPANCAPEFHRRTVGARFRGLVASMVGYRETGTGLSGSVEMAPLVVPLVISFAQPFEIAFGRAAGRDDRFCSFTSGLHPGFVSINSQGGAECIQIDFTPLGAYRFFGLPMRAIASRMVLLDDLGAPELPALRQRLGEERDWERRFDLAEAFVAARMARGPAPDAAVARAWGLLLSSGGAVRVGDLARRMDWSRKHLNQRFQEQIGLGPKAVARMARFNRALGLSRAAASVDWADVAAACGYADQAHLAREFRAFAGAPPTAIVPPRDATPG